MFAVNDGFTVLLAYGGTAGISDGKVKSNQIESIRIAQLSGYYVDLA